MSVKSLLTVAVGLVLLYLLFTAGAPFLLALIVAIFMEPLTALLNQKLRLNRLAAATITSTLFTIGLIGVMALIGVKLVVELIAFWDRVPLFVGEANAYVQGIVSELELYYASISPEAAAQLQSWVASLSDSIASMARTMSVTIIDFAKTLPGLLIFFIVFLVAVYLFSYSLPTMKRTFLSFFDETSRGQVDHILQNLRQSIFGFLRSQLILSLLTYLVALLGLLVLGVKYPLAIALLIVVVDILPILGTGSVLVPWASYLLLTGDLYTGIGLLVLFLFITVFRRVIEPKVLGDAIGIGALPALISLYVGFKLIGVIGIFVGPLVVIIYMAARKAGLFQNKIRLQ